MQHVYTVTEFIDVVRSALTDAFDAVVVQGEVVDFRPSSQQLVFFDLKDADGRVRCFLLKHELRVPLEDGMEIQVLGQPSLFKKNAGFHLRVSEISLLGEGALKHAFLALQRQLAAEGLFAPEHKKPVPRFPFHIGLITSSDAAAYTDVLRVLKNRFRGLTIIFYPVQVQGAGAVRSITSALHHAGNRTDLDVLILTRGGGSLEDLQAFNAEDVARAIFASRVPVVVGVGHERDVTIADDVADLRAATPSNAAELVVPDIRDVFASLETDERRILRTIDSLAAMHMGSLQAATQRLGHLLTRPIDRFQRLRMRLQFIARQQVTLSTQSRVSLDNDTRRLFRSVKAQTQRFAERLQHRMAILQGLSPGATLARGYSITYKTEKGKTTILRSVRNVRRGTQLLTRLPDGTIHSRTE